MRLSCCVSKVRAFCLEWKGGEKASRLRNASRVVEATHRHNSFRIKAVPFASTAHESATREDIQKYKIALFVRPFSRLMVSASMARRVLEDDNPLTCLPAQAQPNLHLAQAL